MLCTWNDWHVKKCCDAIEFDLDSTFDGYWVNEEGELMVIMFEGDADLETVFKLERCPSCKRKIICYKNIEN